MSLDISFSFCFSKTVKNKSICTSNVPKHSDLNCMNDYEVGTDVCAYLEYNYTPTRL